MQAQAQCRDFLEKLSKVEAAALSLEAAQTKELQDSQQQASNAQSRVQELEDENIFLSKQMQNLDHGLRQELGQACEVYLFECCQ